jgi:hypothetical protein
MQVISEFEQGLPVANRVGPSLAPFAKGLVLLAVAESIRDEKAVIAEKVFGANGRAHAAALRQVLNPTQNKQSHRRRASLDFLLENANPMALEAWRAFETWAMISPDEKTLQVLANKLSGAMDPFAQGYAQWREKALADAGQVHLDPILPKEVESMSIFGLGPAVTEAQRVLLRDVIRTGLAGRSTMRPTAPGAQIPAFNTIAAWKAMVGKDDAVALAGELCSDLVLLGNPFPLFGIAETQAAEEMWVDEGLRRFTNSFSGEPEFATVYAMYAALMSEWDRLNRYPRASNAFMQPRAAVIAENLLVVDDVLALLDEDLPLEHAPWVDAQSVISAMAVALLGGVTPAARAALGKVIAYADAHGIDPA